MRREGTTLDECQLKLAAISVGVPTRSAQSRHSETAVGSSPLSKDPLAAGACNWHTTCSVARYVLIPRHQASDDCLLLQRVE
jgi:hypothetical protein